MAVDFFFCTQIRLVFKDDTKCTYLCHHLAFAWYYGFVITAVAIVRVARKIVVKIKSGFIRVSLLWGRGKGLAYTMAKRLIRYYYYIIIVVYYYYYYYSYVYCVERAFRRRAPKRLCRYPTAVSSVLFNPYQNPGAAS